MYICKCNKCDGYFEDTNPQTDAINFPEVDLDSLVNFEDEDGPGQGCPICLTDAYLTDIDEYNP